MILAVQVQYLVEEAVRGGVEGHRPVSPRHQDEPSSLSCCR